MKQEKEFVGIVVSKMGETVELLNAISKDLGLTKSQAKKVIKTFFQVMGKKINN